MNREKHETVQPGLQRHFPHVLIFWPVSTWQSSSGYYNQRWTAPFSAQAPDSKVQSVFAWVFCLKSCLLGSGCWEWWLYLLRKSAPTIWSLHSSPNIYIKDAHICYHEGHSLVRDGLISLGKSGFSLLLSRIHCRSLCVRSIGKESEEFGVITLCDLRGFIFLSYSAVIELP